MSEKAICSKCNNEFSGYVPKGGDGSLLHVVYHKRTALVSASPHGAVHERIKCEGSNRPENRGPR